MDLYSNENSFEILREELLIEAINLKSNSDISSNFRRDFFEIIELVSFSLLHKNENFFGYFMIQMKKDIKFDMFTAAGVTADISHYNIFFNPIIFLKCSFEEMKAEIKHQIYHIIFLHLPRSIEIKDMYSDLIMNMSMDVAVNQYIENLPKWHWTLEKIYKVFNVVLEKEQTFEYYCDRIEKIINLEDIINNDDSTKNSKSNAKNSNDKNNKDNASNDDSDNYSNKDKDKDIDKDSSKDEDSNTSNNHSSNNNSITHDQRRCHDLWRENSSDLYLDNTIDLVKNMVKKASRGILPLGLESIVAKFNKKPELRWQDILKKLVGTLPVPYKKTVMRKDRRQPNRLDLRGRLPKHIIKIVIAIDTSGSIDESQLQKSMCEIFSIIDKHKHEVTIIECDSEIHKVYTAKFPKDIQYNIKGRGGTAFSPVFKYMNKNRMLNYLLIYFTDGYGESRLEVKPNNFRTLWLLTSNGDISLYNPYGIIKKV